MAAGPRLRGWRGSAGRSLPHCKGGLGRAGMVAAQPLVELGMQPDAAIRAIRAARAGTIELAARAPYLRALTPGSGLGAPG